MQMSPDELHNVLNGAHVQRLVKSLKTDLDQTPKGEKLPKEKSPTSYVVMGYTMVNGEAFYSIADGQHRLCLLVFLLRLNSQYRRKVPGLNGAVFDQFFEADGVLKNGKTAEDFLEQLKLPVVIAKDNEAEKGDASKGDSAEKAEEGESDVHNDAQTPSLAPLTGHQALLGKQATKESEDEEKDHQSDDQKEGYFICYKAEDAVQRTQVTSVKDSLNQSSYETNNVLAKFPVALYFLRSCHGRTTFRPNYNFAEAVPSGWSMQNLQDEWIFFLGHLFVFCEEARDLDDIEFLSWSQGLAKQLGFVLEAPVGKGHLIVNKLQYQKFAWEKFKTLCCDKELTAMYGKAFAFCSHLVCTDLDGFPADLYPISSTTKLLDEWRVILGLFNVANCCECPVDMKSVLLSVTDDLACNSYAHRLLFLADEGEPASMRRFFKGVTSTKAQQITIEPNMPQLVCTNFGPSLDMWTLQQKKKELVVFTDDEGSDLEVEISIEEEDEGSFFPSGGAVETLDMSQGTGASAESSADSEEQLLASGEEQPRAFGTAKRQAAIVAKNKIAAKSTRKSSRKTSSKKADSNPGAHKKAKQVKVRKQQDGNAVDNTVDIANWNANSAPRKGTTFSIGQHNLSLLLVAKLVKLCTVYRYNHCDMDEDNTAYLSKK